MHWFHHQPMDNLVNQVFQEHRQVADQFWEEDHRFAWDQSLWVQLWWFARALSASEWRQSWDQWTLWWDHSHEECSFDALCRRQHSIHSSLDRWRHYQTNLLKRNLIGECILIAANSRNKFMLYFWAFFKRVRIIWRWKKVGGLIN